MSVKRKALSTMVDIGGLLVFARHYNRFYRVCVKYLIANGATRR
ncbi:hypothetical protein BH20ACT10_BH20ACT10_05370 [soil metagenome]